MKEDYCTFFPESILGKRIQDCCKKHDLAYELEVAKFKADLGLYYCVKDMGGLDFELIAALMFVAVSTFGFIFYKKKK